MIYNTIEFSSRNKVWHIVLPAVGKCKRRYVPSEVGIEE